MTDRRPELSQLLRSLEPAHSVYFQEPGEQAMTYPAILYQPSDEIRRHANNATYSLEDEWQVTIIDEDPDSPLRKAFRILPLKLSFDRMFRTQGLNHFVYTLYY